MFPSSGVANVVSGGACDEAVVTEATGAAGRTVEAGGGCVGRGSGAGVAARSSSITLCLSGVAAGEKSLRKLLPGVAATAMPFAGDVPTGCTAAFAVARLS